MLLRLRRAVEFLLPVVLGRRERTTVRGRLIRGSTRTLALNALSYLLIFGTSVVLARLLGAGGYGAYAYSVSWAMLLTVPAGLGLSRVTLRSVASYEAAQQWTLIRGHIIWSDAVTLAASTATVLIAAIVLWWAGDRLESAAREAIAVILVLVPLTALLRIRQAATVGLHRVVQGQLPETVLIPALLLAFAPLAYLTAPQAFSAPLIAGLHALAAAVALVAAHLMLRRSMPAAARQSRPDFSPRRRWLRGGLYLTMVGLMTMINVRADVLVLGSLAGAEAAGIYNAAARGAELVGFALLPLVPALSAVVANLHTTGQRERLQNVLTIAARLAVAGAVPVTLALVIFGDWYLALFGSEFTQGATALRILCLNQLLNVAMGLSVHVLIMTGQDRLTALAFGIGAAANLCLNFLLVPLFGMTGAAVATTIGALSCAGAMTVFALRRLGLDATPAGMLHRLHGRSRRPST